MLPSPREVTSPIMLATLRVRIGGTERETTDTKEGIQRWLTDVVLPHWSYSAPLTITYWSGFSPSRVYTR
jgi:hypothetical protein